MDVSVIKYLSTPESPDIFLYLVIIPPFIFLCNAELSRRVFSVGFNGLLGNESPEQQKAMTGAQA